MKEFTFYSREDVDSFVNLIDGHGFVCEVRAIMADPCTRRYIWYVKADKEADFIPPAGESAL